MHKQAQKKYSGRIILFASVWLMGVFATACSPSLALTLSPDGAGTVSWQGTMSPTSQTLLKRFSGNTQEVTGSIFKPDDIRVSLALAGIKADSIATPDSASLIVKASVPNIQTLPADSVRFDRKTRTVTITLSREVLVQVLTLMPPETTDYLELLMAPAFTGETLTPIEYRENVAAAYGKTLATELSASVFTLILSCPETLVSAMSTTTGGVTTGTVKTSGKTAHITIPLTNVLTLSEPIIITAAW